MGGATRLLEGVIVDSRSIIHGNILGILSASYAPRKLMLVQAWLVEAVIHLSSMNKRLEIYFGPPYYMHVVSASY